MTAQLNYLVPFNRKATEVPIQPWKMPYWKHPIDAILAIVSHAYGIPVVDIVSHRRNPHEAWARHVAMWLCLRTTPFSLGDISRAIGKHDKTTVTYARGSVEDARDAYPELRVALDNLKNEVVRRLEETR